jgi:hypothetical protein
MREKGIDYSIANHLEYLMSKWPNEEQLSEYTKNLYRKGEEICKTWANLRISLGSQTEMMKILELLINTCAMEHMMVPLSLHPQVTHLLNKLMNKIGKKIDHTLTKICMIPLNKSLSLKHGLFYRLRKFVGLAADQIGNESLLRNIIKLTALCWTRSIYRYPPLANLIWQSWQTTLPANICVTKPINIPKDWQKHSDIADEIIKACPFCNQGDNNTRKSMGNLEQLHIFCTSQVLAGARSFCHQKIENAIFALYDFASMREYGTLLQETLRISSLQE